MLPVRFEDIGPDDVLRLVADKISERKILEYKQALIIGGQEDRAEFLADVSSFANASGGDIVFGVSEMRDGNEKTGIPEAITPLQIGNPATECARIEQIIESGIQPRIPLVQVKSVDIPEQGPVIVIRVAKSWIAPHMVSYANRTRFYSRNGTGKVQLDVQQLGAAFAAQRSVRERLRDWKAGRIAKALAGDGPVAMETAQILFHFVSPTVQNDGQDLPRVFEQQGWQRDPVYPLISFGVEYERYNADGYLVLSKLTGEGGQSYLQIFRDGSLEYGDSYQLLGDESISSVLLERRVKRTFVSSLPLLKRLGVTDPIYTSLTLLRVKKRQLRMPNFGRDFSNLSEPFDRDVISSPDVMLQSLFEGEPYPTTLLPIVNSIWQAAGISGTPYIRQDGTWFDPS